MTALPRLSRSALLAAMLAGCGRVSFDARADGGGTDGGGTDGAVLDVVDSLDGNIACTMQAALPVPTDGTISGVVGAESTTSGTCGGAAAEDRYVIDVPIAGCDLLLAVDGPQTASDTIAAYIRRSCDAPETELACDTTNGIGRAPAIHLVDVPVGRYYGFVDGVTAAPYGGTFQVLLPEGAACDAASGRDRCGGNLTCTGQCVPTSCAGAIDLTGAPPLTFTATTGGEANLHAGTCGDAADGGLRSPEAIYTLTLATAASDLVIDTDDPQTTFDTLVYVRSACHGVEIACGDDTGSSDRATVHTGPIGPGTYYIFIDGFGGGNGTAKVTITIVP
jgi:hypothetical protein